MLFKMMTGTCDQAFVTAPLDMEKTVWGQHLSSLHGRSLLYHTVSEATNEREKVKRNRLKLVHYKMTLLISLTKRMCVIKCDSTESYFIFKQCFVQYLC